MSRSRLASPLRAGIVLSVSFAALGVLFLTLSLGSLLALLTAGRSANWVGAFGEYAAEAMTFVFGRWVVYLPPVLLALFGVQCFRTGLLTWLRPALRTVGAVLLIASLCALSTLVVSQWDRTAVQRFRAGGALGAFLTAPEGLGLARHLGPVGASLLFGALLVAAGLLLGRYLLRDLFVSASAMRRACAVSRDSLLRSLGWDKRSAQRGREPSRQAARPPMVRPLWDWLIEAPLSALARLFLPRHSHSIFCGIPSPAQGPRILDRRTTVLPPAQQGYPFPSDTGGGAEASLDPRHGRRPRSSGRSFGDSHGFGEEEPVQQELDLFPAEYQIPPLELLNPPAKLPIKISHEEIMQVSARLEQTLREFGVEARVVQVVQGPVVTRFELQPAPGVKVSRISALEREIAMALLAEHVRIQAPIPGKAAVGVEVPNKKTNAVFLREILTCEEFQSHPSPLAFALGKDISGEPVIADLTDMPHLLIAGATGAGKSVCLNTIVVSMLMRMRPDQAKFIMVDPKRVELNNYQDIPHLLAPVVVDPRRAAGALSWVVRRMEERYRELEQLHVRNIAAYNAVVQDALETSKAAPHGALAPMPYIVVVVDELADLMLVARSEVEESIQRLSQMSRAVGIHLILATQRPSVNVITGVIKANLPARIAFRVSSKVDSRTILDCNGAEALVGRGDMLYSPGGGRLFRLQGAYVSDVEVERVADMLREQGPPRYEQEDFAAARSSKNGSEESLDNGEERESRGAALLDDDLYLRALQLVLESKQASVSLIQRRLKIGYARAGRLMDLMQEAGIVGPYQGSKPRELLVDPEEHLAQMEAEGLIVRDGFRPAD